MKNHKTENTAALLGGALMGVAAMYLLDPEMGRKRRAAIKSHTGEYIGDAGEALHSGWEKVGGHARDVGKVVAEKAEIYGQRLSDLAHEYGERLTQHAKDVSDLPDRARAAASHLADSAEGLRNQGHELWNQARTWGRKMHTSARHFSENAMAGRSEEHSSKVVPVVATILGCGAIGGGLMVLMEPRRGEARRAWLKNKIAVALHHTGQSFYRTGKGLANRARGSAYENGCHIASGGPVASESLHEQVRSKIDELISDPSQVHLMAGADGTIVLTGDVPASESRRLITSVESIPGVKLVINRLHVKDGASRSNAPSNSPGRSVPNM
jgi:gas vesicle protein